MVRFLKSAALILVLLAFACVAIATIVGLQLTHPERKPIKDNPANHGLSFEPIEVQSKSPRETVMLKGWLIPAQSPKMTVIFAHGYAGTRQEKHISTLALAKKLHEKGYQIVMFDFRNSGESGGTVTTIGQEEKYDLLNMIKWTKQKFPDQKIGLLGFSMGGATALLAAAESPDVAAVVADSPFNDLHNYLQENMSHWTNLPDVPFTPLMLFMMPYLVGVEPENVSPIKAVERIFPRPVLFIHGDADEVIPAVHSETMYAKHPDVFQYWSTKGVDHVHSFITYPDEYVARVTQFFQSVQQ